MQAGLAGLVEEGLEFFETVFIGVGEGVVQDEGEAAIVISGEELGHGETEGKGHLLAGAVAEPFLVDFELLGPKFPKFVLLGLFGGFGLVEGRLRLVDGLAAAVGVAVFFQGILELTLQSFDGIALTLIVFLRFGPRLGRLVGGFAGGALRFFFTRIGVWRLRGLCGRCRFPFDGAWLRL